MNELKITGIKQQLAYHEEAVKHHQLCQEELKKELEEAQGPEFQPREFVIRVETRSQLMALGAVANRPYQVAEAAVDDNGRIASETTQRDVKNAVDALLNPIFEAAYEEAYRA